MPVIGDMARQGFEDVAEYQEGFLFVIRGGQNDHATLASLFGDIALPGVLDAIDRNAAYPVHEFMGMMEPSSGEFTPNTTALPSLCFDDERLAELYRGQDFHWPRKSPIEWIFMLKGR